MERVQQSDEAVDLFMFEFLYNNYYQRNSGLGLAQLVVMIANYLSSSW